LDAVSLRVARLAAALAALSVLVVGVVWGAWIAGGSDSYCYVEQAERWASGTMLAPQPVGFEPPWRDPWLPLAPTGFVPSPTVPGALAPICPSGLSLTMAAVRVVGGRDAVFLVVPVLGAAAVWLMFLLGSRVAGPAAGALAAVLFAASPIFLFQVVQPMSDVPATAWWLLAVWLVVSHGQLSCGEGVGVRGRAGVSRLLLAGLATAAAVLTRPVLSPLAGVLLAALIVGPDGAPLRERLKRGVCFSLGAAPGAIALAMIQAALYGSPFSSGYGAPSDLFSVAFVGPNLARYARWALETQTPFLLLAIGAFWLPGRRWAATVLLAAIGCVTASYLPYTVFDDWSYLRFLLPAVAFTLVLAAAVATSLATRLPRPWPVVVVVLLATGLGAWYVRTAHQRYVFALRTSEAKFKLAGEYVARALPRSAVVFAIWHSGSVRYYGHRLTIVWDGFPSNELDRTRTFLAQHGRQTYLLLEASEEARFRSRFAGVSDVAALDWPPTAVIGRDLRLYRLADRQAYFEGRGVATTNVFPR
jgi:asparagine N-glycosylation enzyme membrane subunit Stt3